MIDITKRMANSIKDIVAEQWILKDDWLCSGSELRIEKNSLAKLSWEKFEPKDYIG